MITHLASIFVPLVLLSGGIGECWVLPFSHLAVLCFSYFCFLVYSVYALPYLFISRLNTNRSDGCHYNSAFTGKVTMEK
jgi:hypothetical protein